MASYAVDGKVILVTGPARNIGRAIARDLVAHGARVVLAGLEPQRLQTLSDELGANSHWIETDVTSAASVTAAFAAAIERFGHIDVVIANAGIMGSGAAEVATDEFFARMLDVNLLGVYRTLQAAIPHLAKSRGYFLAVSSTASVARSPLQSHYAASKAGVLAMLDAARQEVRWQGIDVGVICPDFVVAEEDERQDTDELMLGLWGNVNADGGVPVQKVAEVARHAIESRVREITAPRSKAWLLRMPRLVQRLFERRFPDEKIELAVRKARQLALQGREIHTGLTDD